MTSRSLSLSLMAEHRVEVRVDRPGVTIRTRKSYVAAPEGTSLSIDYQLSARRRLGALTRWKMASAAPRGFAPELRPTMRRMALQLPAGYNPRTIALARRWRAEAGDGPGADAAIARRAMQLINDEFAYTLAVPLAGREAVEMAVGQVGPGY